MTSYKAKTTAATHDEDALRGKLPPHSIEAEMSLLGSLIAAGTENVHIIGQVSETLVASDFYAPKHCVIYGAILRSYDTRMGLDLGLLIQDLKDSGQYEDIGKLEYLTYIVETVATAANAPHYAKIVKDKSRLRQLEAAAFGIVEAVQQCGEDDHDKVIDAAESQIMRLVGDESAGKTLSNSSEMIQATFDRMQAISEGKNLGIKTGITQFDDMTNGLQPGQLIIVAARPSMGKSAIATTWMTQFAVKEQIPCLMFSMEMGKEDVALRMICVDTSLNFAAISRHQINDDQMAQITESAARVSQSPIYIDDAGGMTPLKVKAIARRIHAMHGLGCIIVDYLQLMESPGNENRQTEVSAISRSLKALARELNIPIVALCQLNRNPEARHDKKPMLGDLRESGSLEQDADVVVLLHREDYYHKDDPDYQPDNRADWIIAKQRNGPTGVCKTHWDGESMRFMNAYTGHSF